MTGRRYLVADLFCGAGGTSTGAEKAIRALGGQMVLVAVNHWPIAIESHRKNHPTARHYVEDVTKARPEDLVPEGRLDLLMASPECTFFSRARGGRPVNDQQRMPPFAIHRWLTTLRVRCVLIENVPEFITWGPLLANGRPDPRKRGRYFEAWLRSFWEMGYKTEWRMLNAADYGDATTRVRFFLQARRDGKPIRWPEPTHAPPEAGEMFGRLPQWRAAREVIDWSNPGRSLLDDPHYRRRPLSPKTLQRISRGLARFGGPLAALYIALLGVPVKGDNGNNGRNGGNLGSAFVMGKQQSPAFRDASQPLPTVTTEGKPALVSPEARPFVLGQQSGGAPRDVGEPLPTVLTGGYISLTQPVLEEYHGKSQGASVDRPLPSQTTKARFGVVRPLVVPYGPKAEARPADEPLPTILTKDRLGLASPFLVPQFGERAGQAPRAQSVEVPAPTVTSHGAGALVNPILVQTDQTGGNGAYSRSVDTPVPTQTTRRSVGLATPCLVDVNHGGLRSPQNVGEPLGTITSKRGVGLVEPVERLVEMDSGRPALVEPILRRLREANVDPRRLVLVDGEPYVLDVRFRMLSNRELARAMGFDDEETRYEFAGTATEVTKQIGNAVPVNLAKALVTAMLGGK